MSNPYLPPTSRGEYRPTGKKYLPPTRAEDYRPAGNQFTLRGLFIFMTATCIILAVLALAIKELKDWIGALSVPLICMMIIVLMEMGRLLFPPKPHFQHYLPPVPQNPLQTAYFGEGESPFDPSRNYFSDNLGSSPFSPPPANGSEPEADKQTDAARASPTFSPPPPPAG